MVCEIFEELYIIVNFLSGVPVKPEEPGESKGEDADNPVQTSAGN